MATEAAIHAVISYTVYILLDLDSGLCTEFPCRLLLSECVDHAPGSNSGAVIMAIDHSARSRVHAPISSHEKCHVTVESQ